MKNLRNLFRGAKDRYATRTAKGTFLSLLLTTCAAFTACNNEVENISQESRAALQLKVGVNQPTSRAIVEGKALPNESQIGVSVVDNTGTAYQNQNYNNVLYTAAEVQGKQTWTTTANVTLSGEEATLYAYYPYAEGADITAIPVDMTETDQKDWMYATPVTGLSDGKSTAEVQLNHALTDLRLTFYKDTYSGKGEVTEFTVQSTGMAVGGTLNAKTGEITLPATPVNTITRTAAFTLTDKATATPLDVMHIPTGAEAPVTVSVTVDGNTYSASTTAFTLQKAKAYNYVMKLTSTGLEVTSVALTDWNEEQLDDATFQPEVNMPTQIKIYAMSANDEIIDYNTADETAKGVVLHATGKNFNKRFMIAKNNAANTGLYWGMNLYGTDVEYVVSIPTSGGTLGDGKIYDSDFTTWTTGPVMDFDGKANTEAITAAYAKYDVQMDALDMCKVLQTFNESGYNDWYIPAEGQLALIYLAKTEIEAALLKIGGTALGTSTYWSSSEADEKYAWLVLFNYGIVSGPTKNTAAGNLRCIRNIP